MTVVTPRTLVAWHRKGFRLFWRWKSASGRRPIPFNLQQLIRRMARQNPSWGEERIAHELLLKLGLRVSPRTIRKYLPKLPATPPGRPRGDQRWVTIIDQWNPSQRRYRTETFCYGPRSCPLYESGSPRKVPGRHGMIYTEEVWVDVEATSHRRLDE